MVKETIQTKYGTAKLRKGYYYISSRKEGNNGKFLHRLIFEDFYKIKLPKHIHIHHNDGNTLNNNIWNLIPLTKAEHTALHNTGKKHSDETKIKQSKSLCKKTTSSGIYRVMKSKCKRCKQGFTWTYRYYTNGKRNTISSVDLNTLKEKVLAEGLEWEVLEEAIQ